MTKTKQQYPISSSSASIQPKASKLKPTAPKLDPKPPTAKSSAAATTGTGKKKRVMKHDNLHQGYKKCCLAADIKRVSEKAIDEIHTKFLDLLNQLAKNSGIMLEHQRKKTIDTEIIKYALAKTVGGPVYL